MLDKLKHPDIINNDRITEYIALRLQNKVTWKTVKNELNGIKHHYVLKGIDFPLDIESNPFISKLKRAFNKINKGTSELRLAFSEKHLITICKNLDKEKSLTSISIKTAISLAFFCMLRPGEYTYKSNNTTSTFKNHHLMMDKSKKQITLHLHDTKTNKGGIQTTVTNCKCHLHQQICPYHNLLQLIELKELYNIFNGPNDPIFIEQQFNSTDYTILRYETLNKKYHDFAKWTNLPKNLLTPHCARISGATWLYLKGVDPEVIKYIGRWGSNCWMRYIRLDDSTCLMIIDENAQDLKQPLNTFNIHTFNKNKKSDTEIPKINCKNITIIPKIETKNVKIKILVPPPLENFHK